MIWLFDEARFQLRLAWRRHFYRPATLSPAYPALAGIARLLCRGGVRNAWVFHLHRGCGKCYSAAR